MKIVITGATGFIGQVIVPALVERGDEVVVLSRDAARASAALGGVSAVSADLQEKGPWTEALAGAGAILHLAGESVAARRWDARQRQVIRDSRVETTRTLVEAIGAMPEGARPAALICASGPDYYPFADPGMGDEDEVTEADPPGDSFLARVCHDWEVEARAAEKLGVRVALMRTGLVLGGGGALAKMTTPFKLFAGGRIGSGKQWVSWIHRADAAAAYVAAAGPGPGPGPGPGGDGYRGPINLVTGSVRNADFARTLGAVMHRPSWLPVPGFAVKLAAGELAEYVLNGRRVVPARLRALGFAWRYPELLGALAAALSET